MVSTPLSDRSILVISPCRNEAAYMHRTLDTMVAQTQRPDLWLIVDDGSTDETPEILAEYAAQHNWIRILTQKDRGHRAVGPGVVEAFYAGLNSVSNAKNYAFLSKLDLDLVLPPRYFQTLVDRMLADPRLGTCSGKPYIRQRGRLVSERKSDDMSVGMTKLWRTACFDAIGGLVREVNWDAIDCHKARFLGWRALSWDHPDLNFEHMRPMGSSQTSIYVGKRRYGFGQHFMGTDPFYFCITTAYRAFEPPFLVGSMAALQGYFGSMLKNNRRQDDMELIRFIRAYQRRTLLVGRKRAMAESEAARTSFFTGEDKTDK